MTFFVVVFDTKYIQNLKDKLKTCLFNVVIVS